VVGSQDHVVETPLLAAGRVFTRISRSVFAASLRTQEYSSYSFLAAAPACCASITGSSLHNVRSAATRKQGHASSIFSTMTPVYNATVIHRLEHVHRLQDLDHSRPLANQPVRYIAPACCASVVGSSLHRMFSAPMHTSEYSSASLRTMWPAYSASNTPARARTLNEVPV